MCSQLSLPHKATQALPCRSHKDLAKETAQHYKKARKFYDGLAAQLVQQGHALDVFACALDQVGPPWTPVCCSAAQQCTPKEAVKLLPRTVGLFHVLRDRRPHSSRPGVAALGS